MDDESWIAVVGIETLHLIAKLEVVEQAAASARLMSTLAIARWAQID